MTDLSLAIVTASTNIERARPCIESWVLHAERSPLIFLIINGGVSTLSPEALVGSHVWHEVPEYLGSVPAFRRGVDLALESGGVDILACLHDDVEILEDGWDTKVRRAFERNPAMGLAGFGGATGLGDLDLYEKPYDPMSLARTGFRSNLEDAEVHGLRSLLAERVAALDSFSLIGRREFWEGQLAPAPFTHVAQAASANLRPWTVLEDLGVVHHCHDGAISCLAARYGWETWFLPVRAKHWGGRTAVGDAGYQAWAKSKDPRGDQGFWYIAHEMCYEAFRDQLPLRV